MSNNKPFLFDSDSLKNFHKRIFFSVLVFCFCFTSAFTKITFISVSSHFNQPSKVTTNQDLKRGNIYDRNGLILAATINSKSLYAQADLINDIDNLSKKLAKILNISETIIKKKLLSKKRFIYLKRLHNIYFSIDENYPEKNIISLSNISDITKERIFLVNIK